MVQQKPHPSPSIKAATIQGLYALTPDSTDTENLLQRVQQGLSGGVRVLQYRNKIAADGLRLQQAIALREITRVAGVIFIINDDAQLAARVDADGVHLGATDGDIKTARGLLGKTKLIGVSCYNQIELARNAVQAGADYVAFGAFYSSSIKPNAAVASLDLLHEARAELSVPIVAIGGIDARNGAALVEAGADAIAVISAVFDVADIQLAAQHLTQLFRNKTA
jgi:thiamine-phosphate pyrophosphorylase